MNSSNNTSRRTRGIGSFFRWDPDVWKPITPLAVLAGIATAVGIFMAVLSFGNWLHPAYAGNDGTQPDLSVILAIGTAFMAFFTALHCRPMDWRTGFFACVAATLVVGVVICITIAAAAVIAVSGSTETVNAALPYAVLISGIPGLSAMLGAVILLGRWPASRTEPATTLPPTTPPPP